MRRSPVEEGRRWLEQAREDLKWARRLREEGGYYLACFLAQQVAEKALKALLYANGESLVLGHSVEELGGNVTNYAPHLKDQVRSWAVLDGYYIPTRYPNGLPASIPARVYSEAAAEEAVRLAEEVVNTMSGLIDAI